MKINDWTEEILKEEEELAQLQAEVIASKTVRANYRDFLTYGPGRIIDIELNLEKIFKV